MDSKLIRDSLKDKDPIAIRIFLRGALADGDIDPRGKTFESFAAEAAVFLRHASKRRKHVASQDHRPSILASARRARSEGDLTLACVLLALWCEHWINGVVAALAVRRALAEDLISQMLRDTPLHGKLSWLLSILDARPIASAHRATILDLANRRNAFVHYKWKRTDVDDWGETWGELRSDPALGRVLDRVDSTVLYLRQWEEQYVFLGASPLIEEFISNTCVPAAVSRRVR